MHTVPLNPNVFEKNVEQVPIRKGFGEGLLQAGEEDHRVVALCADLTESTVMHLFRNRFPERFVEVGIAEQSMASLASGLAAMGKVPFFASYAMFSPGRNWEQIRTTICYNHVNAKVVGAHAGISVGPDGGTHQPLEDIGLMRMIPRMMVIVPCDAIEAKKATLALAKYDGPAYIRLAREATPIITTAETPIELGKAQLLYLPHDGAKAKVGLIASGAIAHTALLTAKRLNEAGIPTAMMNLATIKPLDEEAVRDLAQDVELIVTIEEHQQRGGMGSEIAEYLSKHKPTRQIFIGVNDEFGQTGTPDELLKHYELDADSIFTKVMNALR